MFIHNCLALWFADSEVPISPPGVKNVGLLESATARPFIAIAGQDVYPSPFGKAGALLHSLVQNHPFFNGNKRTALVSTLVFLANCGIWVEKCSDDEMYDFTVSVAAHKVADRRYEEVEAIAAWFKNNSSHQGVERKIIQRKTRDFDNVEKLLSGGQISISYSVSEIIEFRRIYDSTSKMLGERDEVMYRLAQT
jgi:death-on-curing family protein